MKFVTCLIFSFLVLHLSGFAQEKTFTFKGQVHAYGKTLKGAIIEVYETGELVHETATKGGGKFDFQLQAEREYLVEISMENLRTKTIWINTKRTQKLEGKVPIFSFDVHLKKEKTTVYDELSEIPVTLIKYQPETNVFYMDKTYEDAIENKKRRIKESGLQMR